MGPALLRDVYWDPASEAQLYQLFCESAEAVAAGIEWEISSREIRDGRIDVPVSASTSVSVWALATSTTVTIQRLEICEEQGGRC